MWYIIWIISSSPTDFTSEKIGLNRVTYDPPVSIRVNKYLKFCSLFLSLFFFSFRSDCKELDFKEISYLVDIHVDQNTIFWLYCFFSSIFMRFYGNIKFECKIPTNLFLWNTQLGVSRPSAFKIIKNADFGITFTTCNGKPNKLCVFYLKQKLHHLISFIYNKIRDIFKVKLYTFLKLKEGKKRDREREGEREINICWP